MATSQKKSKQDTEIWKNVVPAAEVQRQSKRQALLREAAASFNRQGFHGTSLNDVAKKLGVTKAALYTYVPSKEDLLYFCHDWAMDGAFESLEQARLEGRSGLERFRIALRHYLERILTEEGGFVILLEENALNATHAKAIIKRRDKFEAEMRSFVTEGMKDGSIVKCNAKLAVFMALGALNWVRKWYSPEGAWSGQEIADALSELIARSVAASPHVPKGLK